MLFLGHRMLPIEDRRTNGNGRQHVYAIATQAAFGIDVTSATVM